MSKGKVYMITGQPDWKSTYLIGDPSIENGTFRAVDAFFGAGRFNSFSGVYDPIGPVAVEEWLFNRGKNRFMQILRFENERLVSIQKVGYGFGDFHKPKVINPDWSTLKIGDTSFELLKRFGEPSLTEAKPEITFVQLFGPRGHPLYYHSADVSWWYYNAGPKRLFRIVKLINGRVVDIETEGFGLSKK